MRQGEIHNIELIIQQLKNQLEILNKLKDKGYVYFTPYPVNISSPDELGLPRYKITFLGVKLYNIIHSTYSSPWSKKHIILRLQMNKPVKVIKNEESAPLNGIDKKIVKFIASDGYYVFVKFENAKCWVKIGQYVKPKKGENKND